MAFTVRASEQQEQNIEDAKKHVKATKKGEILLEAVAQLPDLHSRIRTLEQEVYRLQRVESEQKRIKSFFKELVS
ncbi:hypothetical protein ACP6H1_21925 [Vibrio harveyi]|uniref:hypothetical protein n=1 Tax=Vibrio harveyi TaxID=669 RepID=UPI003CF124FF